MKASLTVGLECRSIHVIRQDHYRALENILPSKFHRFIYLFVPFCWSQPRVKSCLGVRAGFRLLINTVHVKCARFPRRHAKCVASSRTGPSRLHLWNPVSSYLEADVTALRCRPWSHSKLLTPPIASPPVSKKTLRRRSMQNTYLPQNRIANERNMKPRENIVNLCLFHWPTLFHMPHCNIAHAIMCPLLSRRSPSGSTLCCSSGI